MIWDMVYTAIVVDDEYYVLKQQKKLLASIENLSLKAGFLKASEAFDYLKKNGPVDIIFSDIEMGGLSGLDLAAEYSNYTRFLVFITGYAQYSGEAFSVGAGDYLAKPVTVEDIQGSINKFSAWRSMPTRKPDTLKTVNVWDGTRKTLKIIELTEVISMVKNGNYIDINTKDGTWMHLETMKMAEAKFCHTGQFIRVNQSVIVAMQMVDFIQEKRIVHLKNGTKFDLSKGYRAAFMEELMTQSY